MEIYVNKNIDFVINEYDKTGYFYDLKNRFKYNVSWAFVLYLLILDSDKPIALDDKIQEKLSEWVMRLYNDDILTKRLNNSRRISNIVRKELEKPLKKVQIEITNTCNFNCKHCFNSKKKYAILSYDMIKKIIDECKKIGVNKICLTGGEPFTHPNIKEIIDYLYSNNMSYEIYTNAYFLNEETVAYLNKRNISNVRLSLDGMTKEVHDSFRNITGSFDKVIGATKFLNLYNIPYEINTMLHKLNSSIIEFQRFVDNNLGKIHVVYDYILNIGNATKNYEDIGISIEQFCDSYIEFYRQELNKGVEFDVTTSRFCGIGYNFLYITATGVLKICSSVSDEYNIGNVFEESIEKCWMSNEARCYRDIQCEEYAACQYNRICKGGCRSRAQILGEENTLTSPDIIYCNIFSKLFSEK